MNNLAIGDRIKIVAPLSQFYGCLGKAEDVALGYVLVVLDSNDSVLAFSPGEVTKVVEVSHGWLSVSKKSVSI